MSAEYVQNGEHIDWVNDSGVDKSYNDIIDLGSCLGVVQADVLAGATGVLELTGVFTMPSATDDDFDPGEKLYWDGTKLVATSASGTNTPVGICVLAKVTATATARVRLIPGMG